MKINKGTIVIVSILVPVVVAIMFFLTTAEQAMSPPWMRELPKVNASINSLTIIILIAALYFIRQGNERLHRNLMLTAMVLGAIFLVSYITYHANVPSAVFGDVNHDLVLSDSEREIAGMNRSVYLILLLAHILLSIVGLPFILFAVYRGLNDERGKHKRLVRIAYPVWLLMALSGVLVYFLISPYY
ncbi:MAG: DUF420 domain-containing protein [Bacteroidota bacterium]